MFGRILEVALVAFLALCLLAPVVWRAVRLARGSGADARGRSTADRDEARRRYAGWVGGALLAIAILNFLAYSAHTGDLGGSADHTKRAEGRYFVSSHGKYTAVTEEQWRAVRAHGIAVNITHPVGVLVGGFLLFYSQRRREPTGAEPGTAPNPSRTEAS